MSVLQFENLQIIANFDKLSTTPGGYILKGPNVSLHTPFEPSKYYHHGWHSWSLAAWTNLEMQPRPKPRFLLARMTDPVYSQHPSPNGSWLGAVEFKDGNILLLGSLGLDSHVQFRNGNLEGWYEHGESENQPDWFAGYGREDDVFNTYAHLLSKYLGAGRAETTYRVWCSWYGLYTAINEQNLQTIFTELGDLPFDVFQIDDGWQIAIGDWDANKKFPSGMAELATKIKATGRKADWVLRDENKSPVSATHNWGEQLYALDTSHPAVLDWLAKLMKKVVAWGYEYIKLDFLYAGALPGKRYLEVPREAAYRQGLAAMREALGENVYLLTCGTPILPALGLCDAMRIGPDVAEHWESYRDDVLLNNPSAPGAKNAVRTTINRLWLAPLVHTDPDVAYFRSRETGLTAEQKGVLQDLAQVCRFKATSDLPQWLTSSERNTLNQFLEHQPLVIRTGRYSFSLDGRKVDFSKAMALPAPTKGVATLASALTDWLGSQPFTLRLLNKLENNKWEKRAKDL
jgi:alpha-galactosidase